MRSPTRVPPGWREVRGEFAELGGFAGAVQAFEGEEESAGHKSRLQGTGYGLQGTGVQSLEFRV